MFEAGRLRDLYNAFSERELTWMFGAGAVLLVLAAVLLATNRARIVARTMAVLGVLVVMVGLFVIHQQTVIERPTQQITVTRPRFPESLRFQIRLALFGLPIMVAALMTTVYFVTRQWLRSTLPDLLSQGLRLFYERKYDEALATFNKAIDIEPRRADLFYQRGCVREALGQNSMALSDFDQALRFDPRHLSACIRRGRLRTAANDVDGALSDFERALDILPNDVQALLNRGICLSRKGRVSEAIVDFDRVLRLTNHTDFAEPAKHYLRLYGVKSDAAPLANNGQPSPSESAPHDYVI
ncbi:MAG: tetratricopeptide repeat protein [Isosphaeraceae bacterium]